MDTDAEKTLNRRKVLPGGQKGTKGGSADDGQGIGEFEQRRHQDAKRRENLILQEGAEGTEGTIQNKKCKIKNGRRIEGKSFRKNKRERRGCLVA